MKISEQRVTNDICGYKINIVVQITYYVLDCIKLNVTIANIYILVKKNIKQK